MSTPLASQVMAQKHAQLIAATPDLVDALKAVLRVESDPSLAENSRRLRVTEIARAALLATVEEGAQ